MNHFLTFHLNRLKEKLWVRPLLVCIISVAAVVLARKIESLWIAQHLPEISSDSLEALLTTLTASMLVIATFAVGSMVSAYATAGHTATPRTFPLIIADDVSQNALSTFIGAFIFSVVALVFQKNGYYGISGRFVLFVLTCIVFAIVILTFVHWVDRIARLGRLGETIDKVEHVTAGSLRRRREHPTLDGRAYKAVPDNARPVQGNKVGYVQRIDLGMLQTHAEEAGLTIYIDALPGAFVGPDRMIAHVSADQDAADSIDTECIRRAFRIGDTRTFDDDPRFGLIVLSEIAGKALSPAVNDPGTAIDVIGTFVRLFTNWAQPLDDDDRKPGTLTRLYIRPLSAHDMFDDAFTSIARDGAGSVEVMSRLQKALRSLATLDDPAIKKAATDHSRLALARAENAMTLPEDLEIVRKLAEFSRPG